MGMDLCLLQLLRKELWQTDDEIDIQSSQVATLLKEAENQAVLGLIIHALLKSDVMREDEQMYFEAIGLLIQIQHQNKRVDKQLDAFETLMDEVPHVVVKGQMVARRYPDGSLRQSGDIDFYCEPAYYQRAKSRLLSVPEIEWQKSDSLKHEVFVWDEVLFEMHASLMLFYVRKHQRYWDKEVVYVFAHLFYHLIVGGVGLKQFCDLTMTIHHHRDELDPKRLRRHLEGLGISCSISGCGVDIG